MINPNTIDFNDVDLDALDLESVDWANLKAPTVQTVSYSILSKEEQTLFRLSWEDYHQIWVEDVAHKFIETLAKHYKSHVKKGVIGLISLCETKGDKIMFNFHKLDLFSPSHQHFAYLQTRYPSRMPVVFLASKKHYYFQGCIGKEVFLDIPLTIHLDLSIEHALEEDAVIKSAPKPRQQPEQKLEDQLYDWLRIKGVDVERQVTTAKHRLDLWIPSKAMLELKQGRVSGDDVCQAIDYAATYQMPIVLVGTGLSSNASRGIDGFNRAMGKDLIIFVTWGGVKPYLNGII